MPGDNASRDGRVLIRPSSAVIHPDDTVTKDLIIVGAGGFAPEGIWVAEDTNAARAARGESSAWNILGYTVYDPAKFPQSIYSHPVIGAPDEVQATLAGRDVYFICMIGDNRIRAQEARRAEGFGWMPATLIHPSAIIAREAHIAPGAYIAAGAIVAPFANIGRHTIVNHHASIGHNSTMEDYSQAGPGARVNGRCFVGRSAFLGSNAALLPQTKVGEGAVVSAGSMVVDTVDPFTTVIGTPARVIRAAHTEAVVHTKPGNGEASGSAELNVVPKRLTAVFREIFDNPSLAVTYSMSQHDMPEWDSIAQVKLLLAVEQEFGVSFTTDEAARFLCVGDIVHALDSHRQ